MKNLKEIDKMVFTGERKINFEVRCADISEVSIYFSEGSTLAVSKEDYLQNCSHCGLTPNKRYRAIAIYGVGDVYDVIIEKNDYDNKKSYMSGYFIDID